MVFQLVLSNLVVCVLSSAQLDIHIFNVGQADSQLIVFPSGYSILIDAGETSSGSMNCKKIAERVKSILGHTRVDVGVVTHLHQDHVGVPYKSGFWYLIEQSGLTFGTIVDRDSGEVKDGIVDCATEDDINWHTVGTISSTAIKWVCYSTTSKLFTSIQGKRVLAEYCAHLITPPDVDSTVDIIGVNANGVLDNSQVLTGDHRSEQYPPSENDYTIALRIQFGDFVYFTAGDLDGEDSKSSYKYKYHNVESTYKTFIGQVDVYHADHHGSEHSNNKDFLSTLLPTVSLISCGAGNSYGHPTQKALENMQLTSKIFLTQDCNPTITDKYPNAVIVLNDEIVVSYTKDSSTYTVSDSQNSKSHTFAIKSNKPKPEVCN